MSPVKLRKKKPFICRYVAAGAVKVCAAVLTDDDGDYCKPCAEASERAKQNFYEKPIAPAIPAEAERPYRVRAGVWP